MVVRVAAEQPTLRGDRVQLRPLAPEDAGALRAVLRHAWIDLFVDPRLHGRGLGTDAVRAVARHLFDERGHHRVTIDPAQDKVAAVRCYEKAGFRPVGTMRRAWRDPWGRRRDALLMELVEEPDQSMAGCIATPEA